AYVYNGLPAYLSIQNVDSLASQVRISMGLGGGFDAAFESKFGRPNCRVDRFGIAEIWIWAEPKGNHTAAEIKAFHPVAPKDVAPPLQCAQLKKLPEPVIWPRPKQMERLEGRFEVKPDTAIVFANSGMLPEIARQLQADVERRFGVKLV